MEPNSAELTTAICAGPRVLDAAGALEGRAYTCYPGQEEKIEQGHFEKRLVVRDGNVITAVGPAACYAFGTAWFIVLYTRGGSSITVMEALKKCVLPFAAFDCVKLGLAILLETRIGRYLNIGNKS